MSCSLHAYFIRLSYNWIALSVFPCILYNENKYVSIYVRDRKYREMKNVAGVVNMSAVGGKMMTSTPPAHCFASVVRLGPLILTPGTQ